ncbi:hypothetical protein V2I01_14545 [Micromonospora sp. BRA006-A]|nr:hypothetical protein [Micromonospora sp. BRA006-A]
MDGILLVGYLLARQIYDAIGDKIDRYILPVVALIIVISVLPIFFEFLRDRRARKRGEAVAVITAATVAGTVEAAREGIEEHRPGHGDGTVVSTTAEHVVRTPKAGPRTRTGLRHHCSSRVTRTTTAVTVR